MSLYVLSYMSIYICLYIYIYIYSPIQARIQDFWKGGGSRRRYRIFHKHPPPWTLSMWRHSPSEKLKNTHTLGHSQKGGGSNFGPNVKKPTSWPKRGGVRPPGPPPPPWIRHCYMSPIYIQSPIWAAPYIYIPRWPVLGSGTNNAGQLTAIHTTCRGVARLVLLRHATGRAIRSTRTTSRASGRGKSCNCRTTGESYDQLRQWRTTSD